MYHTVLNSSVNMIFLYSLANMKDDYIVDLINVHNIHPEYTSGSAFWSFMYKTQEAGDTVWLNATKNKTVEGLNWFHQKLLHV